MSIHDKARQLVESILGPEPMDMDDFRDFVNELSTKEAKVSIAEKSICKFLDRVVVDESSKQFDTADTKKISEENIQSIGKVIEYLESIHAAAEKCTQKVGIFENIGAYAKPLGMLIGQIKDALDNGKNLIASQKFLEQMQNRWYDLTVNGEMIKKISEG
jgi:hypothetical protein